nr:MAG TPA: hypothetical protein [Caudoviricetes sp.]
MFRSGLTSTLLGRLFPELSTFLTLYHYNVDTFNKT